jgi:putative ABC transport system ATP-binding protein
MLWLCAHGVRHSLEDGERRFSLEIAALTLGPGSRKAIVGPSGSGKTTAMDLLALASTPKSADSFVLIEEQGAYHDLAPRTPAARGDAMAALRARHFGYVLQTGMLLPFLTVGENVLLSQTLAGVPDPSFAAAVLEQLGVSVSLSTMPAALSIGQRQRVAVARALAHKPAFIFADEPTASLDPDNARRTLGTCLDVGAVHNAAILMITHDLELARELDFEIVSIITSAHGNTVHAVVDDGTMRPHHAGAS